MTAMHQKRPRNCPSASASALSARNYLEEVPTVFIAELRDQCIDPICRRPLGKVARRRFKFVNQFFESHDRTLSGVNR